MLTLEKRLAIYTGSWKANLESDLKNYLRTAGCYFLRDRSSGKLLDPPFWIRVPFWFRKKWMRENNSSQIKFPEDFPWAQFCVYLGVKIRDDHFDGQTEVSSPELISGLLFGEAKNVLKKYFGPRTNFWKVYEEYIAHTFDSIKNIDRLQKSKSPDLLDFDEEYRKVSSVLKIASLAFFMSNGKMKEYSAVSEYLDLMSAGSQLLDDYFDIEEDLEAGRINYAARLLLNGIIPDCSTRELKYKVYEQTIKTDSYEKVFDKIANYYTGAHAQLKSFGLEREEIFHRQNLEYLERMKREIHTGRVRAVLGSLIKSS